MYGNMTNVEKNMNKDDLVAWKNYDNNQYSLIPGVTSQKKIPDRSQSN
jgi:murein tripeptide amidase MpaA